MLFLAALVLVLNVTTALRVEKVSAIDEQYWMDHMLRGADFTIERGGVPILQETVREKCARGMQPSVIQFDPVPPCRRGHLNPREYGYWHGVNIAGKEPFYFLVTGPIARALRATPLDLAPNDSLITWARLLGSAWMLAGLYCLIRVGEILAVHRRLLVVASVFVATTPALLHANTIVNPDATAFLAGAATLLAALSWERSGRRMWMLGLVATAAALFNEKNAIAILLVLMYFGFRALARRIGETNDDDGDVRTWQEYVKASVLLVIALYLANNGWDWLYGQLQAHVFTSGPVADISNNPISRLYGDRNAGFWDYFGLNTIFRMFPPFQDISPPDERTHVLYLTVTKAAEFVAIGGLLAVAFRDKLTSKLSVLGFATLSTLLIAPSLTVLRNQVVGGTFDEPVWRYGLGALPALAIIVAASARTRFAQIALTAFTALLYVSALYVLF
jgi:hypothetical protein